MLTRTPAPESEMVWTPDSRKLAYVSTRDGADSIYEYDFATQKETRLTTPPAGSFDLLPRFSLDREGLWRSCAGERSQARTIELASKTEKVVATGLFERPPFVSRGAFEWSPDGKWIAYFNEAGKGFANLYLTTAAGSETHQVSFLANTNRGGLAWAHDGKYLLFTTNQRTEQNHLVQVDLILRTPKFREDLFRDLFKEEPAKSATGGDAKTPVAPAKPEPKPAEPAYNFTDIRQRLRWCSPMDLWGLGEPGREGRHPAGGGGWATASVFVLA